jgi:integrase
MAENVGRRGSTWYYRLDLPVDGNGRRRQKRVSGFRTEREAKAALAAAQMAVSQGRLRSAGPKTFGDLATEWLAAVEPNRKATTAANYRLLVRSYLVPHLGGLRLDRISPSTIQQVYAVLRSSGGRDGRPLSGTQVRNIHRVLHNVLAYAVRVGYLSVNAADQVEKPREDTAERQTYTPEQVQQFLESVASDRLRALWHLAVVTGLRRGELAGLRWRDLDLDGSPPRLTVRSTRATAAGQIVETDPKTRTGRRNVVLDAATAEIVRQHRDVMEKESTVRGEARLPAYVFVDEMGEPVRPPGITRRLHTRQKACGLPLITLHDLRHTSATLALLAGVHPKVVAERHGHASTQITLDRYSHVLESMQTDAAEAIGRMLQPKD